MLEAKNLSFGYPKGEILFSGLDLAIGRGERVALQAPSGYGKTTLCRVLAGYEKPLDGVVRVSGKPLDEYRVCPVQMIAQHPERTLDPRMRMGASLREAGVIDEGLVSALGIRKEWMRRFPHELSGGELQRFCICRTLVAKPRYLIADEISTMLDALTQAQIWSFLLGYLEECSVGLVFVSHSPALTRRIATRSIELARTTVGEG